MAIHLIIGYHMLRDIAKVVAVGAVASSLSKSQKEKTKVRELENRLAQSERKLKIKVSNAEIDRELIALKKKMGISVPEPKFEFEPKFGIKRILGLLTISLLLGASGGYMFANNQTRSTSVVETGTASSSMPISIK